MKKVSILAAIALVVVGCNKKSIEDAPLGPVMPDREAPISFGVGGDVQITPAKAITKAAVALPNDTKLGVFAFQGKTLPTSASTANGALWGDRDTENLEYTWNASAGTTGAFKESGTSPKLFWPTTVAGTKLSFASYFPYTAAGVSAFVLTQDMADQTADATTSKAPDYGFAWAKLDNVERPNPIVSKQLAFNYKVAKLSFAIMGDSDDGIQMQTGGTGEGIVAINVYGASTGFYQTYKLNLLDGTSTGSGDLNSSNKMQIQGIDASKVDNTVTPAVTTKFVTAEAFVVPSTTDAGLKSDGIVVEIMYNDGTNTQSYKAEIKAGDKLTGKAALEDGLEVGTNYKYTLKLGKSLTVFTGKVVDWNEVTVPDVTLE